MANSFAPTYQDYLNAHLGQLNGGSEGGQGTFSGLTPEQFAALSVADQWRNIGNGLFIDPSDSRYGALAQQLGVTAKNGPDSLIGIAYGTPAQGMLVDPNAVVRGDNTQAYAHQNMTPAAEFQGGGLNDLGWALAALSVLGGGAALGTALGGAGAGAGGAAGVTGSNALATGGFGTDIGAGSGTFAGTAGGAAGAAGTTTSSGGFDANGAYHDIPSMDPVQAGTLDPIGPDAAQLSTGNGLLSGLGDKAGGLLGQAGEWAAAHPLQALGLAQTAYGLLGGGNRGSGSSGSSGGSKGGSGTPSNITVQRQFYTNPYIQAQIQRGYGQ